MRRGRMTANSEAKLFCPIVSGKSEKLRDSGGLSYSRFWELLKQKLEELGFHTVDFGMHSLRAGGATSAAAAGILDRVFKKHGRWKSETAKDGYIEDSQSERLCHPKLGPVTVSFDAAMAVNSSNNRGRVYQQVFALCGVMFDGLCYVYA